MEPSPDLGNDRPSEWSIPRGIKFIAIVGWVLVSAIAFGVAELEHWHTVTAGQRPLIFLLTAILYWPVVMLTIGLRYRERGVRHDRPFSGNEDANRI